MHRPKPGGRGAPNFGRRSVYLAPNSSSHMRRASICDLVHINQKLNEVRLWVRRPLPRKRCRVHGESSFQFSTFHLNPAFAAIEVPRRTPPEFVDKIEGFFHFWFARRRSCPELGLGNVDTTTYMSTITMISVQLPHARRPTLGPALKVEQSSPCEGARTQL